MGIEIIRQPSETPNITPFEDIIGLRYAYGNQNGYIADFGSELNGTYENGRFAISSGLAVIQGVEVEVDQNGINTTIDTGGTRYFKIYLKVNFADNTAVLESKFSTKSYADITDPTSESLMNGGDAYLPLYSLKLNGTIEVEKNKIAQPISYFPEQKKFDNFHELSKFVNGLDKTKILGFSAKVKYGFVLTSNGIIGSTTPPLTGTIFVANAGSIIKFDSNGIMQTFQADRYVTIKCKLYEKDYVSLSYDSMAMSASVVSSSPVSLTTYMNSGIVLPHNFVKDFTVNYIR